MTHISCKESLFQSACTALLGLTFSAVAMAQGANPLGAASGAAPGTPAIEPQAPVAAASSAEAPKFVRYLRVGPNGTSARNLGDANGVSIGKLSAGSLIAVFKEEGDWLECEVPGGFEIWVFGMYVKASSEAGVLEITGSDVRARPLASSGVESYPLQPNLSRGDRVRLITRKDSSKSLAEDWVKVYSPPGVRGFVAKADCEALPAGMDGAKTWSTAVADTRKRKPADNTLLVSTPVVGVALPAGAAAVQGDLTPQQALEELQRADSALAQERRAKQPNYAPVRAQYERVLASTKEGATADMAKRGLSEVDALVELQSLKGDLQNERARAAEDLERRKLAMKNAEMDADAFSGRFDTRGWLEKRVVPGQQATYLLRWGGDVICEIQCNSGRYDLSTFNGCEMGIKGRELRAAVPGDIGRVPVPRLIDASRIEVISCRPSRR